MIAKSINWDAIITELAGMEVITNANQLEKLSLDYYHFSPILQPQLANKRGNLVVRPKQEEEVKRVVQTCVRHQIPLTVRGAGTGNYGQCIPLEGGIILDTTSMNAIRWIRGDVACVEPGVKIIDLDREAKTQGWELRMYPSTYRSATIGGFIGGGSGGIGSITYGQLRDRGNVLAAKVMTMEDPPQRLELRGDDVQKVNHAYGTNGIITELEIALAPAYPWADTIVVFDEFMQAARFGQALSDADGLLKKLVCICADPIPSYFTPLKSHLPTGKHCALLMVAESSLEGLQDLIQEYGGEQTYCRTAQQPQKGLSLPEFTWNHTTLHARSIDPTLTYLQTFFFNLEIVEEMYRHFGDEVPMHLEFLRVGGKAIPAGLQLVRFTTEERLNEIIRYHEERGALIANPHTYILEDGGRKVINPLQLAFKEKVDPNGLMNPGKMRAWLERK
ncbi:FAD-binding oxidoreductase [Lusitaniella coriacea LEGE 07157]|uniref:FAD-binding oxidoreductase n=1 Tax=Lusitaniella coriacea LEGE 07157 TaxID=945747 RepID=A0A8J7JAL7_9CYAN|nr:FAD-binding oxidoreductase [Lusitaniella coriacea]MBE9116470.1 FAD-binding oxidoreductase [Lusitaniella coriacea LEGE 07157]